MTAMADMPLREVQAWLRDRVDDGVTCPCCTQFAKVYRRKINSGMARGLIRIWRKAGQDWMHLNSTISSITHEGAQLAWWGLIEQQPGETTRDDGGRSSVWRITDLGRRFVLNQATVPKYARVYDKRLMRLIPDQHVSIVDALGTKFNYHDLMEGL